MKRLFWFLVVVIPLFAAACSQLQQNPILNQGSGASINLNPQGGGGFQPGPSKGVAFAFNPGWPPERNEIYTGFMFDITGELRNYGPEPTTVTLTITDGQPKRYSNVDVEETYALLGATKKETPQNTAKGVQQQAALTPAVKDFEFMDLLYQPTIISSIGTSGFTTITATITYDYIATLQASLCIPGRKYVQKQGESPCTTAGSLQTTAFDQSIQFAPVTISSIQKTVLGNTEGGGRAVKLALFFQNVGGGKINNPDQAINSLEFFVNGNKITPKCIPPSAYFQEEGRQLQQQRMDCTLSLDVPEDSAQNYQLALRFTYPYKYTYTTQPIRLKEVGGTTEFEVPSF